MSTVKLSFSFNLEVGLSAGIAGLLNSVIVCPSELVKCKMQMQKKVIIYESSYKCAKSILKTDGIPGIFQGGVATCFREIPAYIAQFCVYEFLKRNVFGSDCILGKPEIKQGKINFYF